MPYEAVCRPALRGGKCSAPSALWSIQICLLHLTHVLKEKQKCSAKESLYDATPSTFHSSPEVPSREAVAAIFAVFRMPRMGIEPSPSQCQGGQSIPRPLKTIEG